MGGFLSYVIRLMIDYEHFDVCLFISSPSVALCARSANISFECAEIFYVAMLSVQVILFLLALPRMGLLLLGFLLRVVVGIIG